MKKIALFFLMATLLYGCCNEQKCREKYPCLVMTKEECISTYGLNEGHSRPPGPSCMITIDAATATDYINRFVTMNTDEKTGMCIPPCALYEIIVDSAATGVCVNFGIKPDNSHTIVVKYQSGTGAIHYGDVQFDPTFGEPHCPPGTRCG